MWWTFRKKEDAERRVAELQQANTELRREKEASQKELEAMRKTVEGLIADWQSAVTNVHGLAESQWSALSSAIHSAMHRGRDS